MSETFEKSYKQNLEKLKKEREKGKEANVKLKWDENISDAEKARNNSPVRPEK